MHSEFFVDLECQPFCLLVIKHCIIFLYSYRQTQWDPPTADGAPPAAPNEYEMDLGTPTYDEKTKRKTTTAAADTSTELAKRTKESFRSKVRHDRVGF